MTEATSTIARSADGTRIGFRTLGDGPGVVIVHGAMQSGDSQRELAALLAERHRVHLVDRRGRGESGPYPAGADASVEVEDLRAVLAASGAHRVLGISSGAIIAARAALAEPAIERLALFEPPLAVDGSVRLGLAAGMDAATTRGDLATAMALAMKMSEMGPPWMFGLPVPVLAAFSRRALGRPGIRALAEALPVDVRIVREHADRAAAFAAIAVPTLIVDGTATRPYLRTAAETLARTIPHARRVRLPGRSHAVTQNRDQYGRPEAVAPALIEFFAG